MFEKHEKENAVSPVIGVILLVAVTVALVALATVIVFDIGSDVSDTSDATVQLEQSGTDMTATVIRNENVEDFTLQGNVEDGTTATSTLAGAAGSSASLAIAQSGETGDVTINVEDETGVDFAADNIELRNSDGSVAASDVSTSSLTSTEETNDFTAFADVDADGDGTVESHESATFTHDTDTTNITITFDTTDGTTSDSGEVESGNALGTIDLTSVTAIANLEDGSTEVLTSTDVSE